MVKDILVELQRRSMDILNVHGVNSPQLAARGAPLRRLEPKSTGGSPPRKTVLGMSTRMQLDDNVHSAKSVRIRLRRLRCRTDNRAT
jgi:hypothetical protein